MEKALLKTCLQTQLMEMGKYQTGFKNDASTHIHISRLIRSIKEHQQEDKRNRKIYMFVDLKKAYDSVKRDKLFGILAGRVEEMEDPKAMSVAGKIGKVLLTIHKEGKMQFD